MLVYDRVGLIFIEKVEKAILSRESTNYSM